MTGLSKAFWFVTSVHWIALLYIYGAYFLPPDCTRVGPVLIGMLFTPALLLAYALGATSDGAFYAASFIQCLAYTWLFWLMAHRQARHGSRSDLERRDAPRIPINH